MLSGGNVDPLLLLQIIQHGMKAGGRYLALRLRIPDRPGSLAALLAQVSELGANVVDVEHSRVSGALRLGEAEVALDLETRGQDHCALVTEALHAVPVSLPSCLEPPPEAEAVPRPGRPRPTGRRHAVGAHRLPRAPAPARSPRTVP